MLRLTTLVVRSLMVFTLAATCFGADQPKPSTSPAAPAACASLVLANPASRFGDIDAYGRCVFQCLQRRGTPDDCAQRCAPLLQQRTAPEKANPEELRKVGEEGAEPSRGE